MMAQSDTVGRYNRILLKPTTAEKISKLLNDLEIWSNKLIFKILHCLNYGMATKLYTDIVFPLNCVWQKERR